MPSLPPRSADLPSDYSDDEMVVPAPAELDKAGLFDHIAREHDGFAFTVDDAPKVDVLCQRLGPLAGRHVIEPGCGSGHLTEQLARWTGPDGRVVAFDPSVEMIARAHGRTATFPQVALQCATLEGIELPALTFDCVVCFRVWPHFEDDDRAVGCIRRWLKSGGRLLIVHWAGREKLAAIHATHHSVAADVFPSRAVLEGALQRHGFTVTAWIDTPEEIFIEAVCR